MNRRKSIIVKAVLRRYCSAVRWLGLSDLYYGRNQWRTQAYSL